MNRREVYDSPDQVTFRSIQFLGSGAVGVVDEVEGTANGFENRIYARKTVFLSPNPRLRNEGLEEINNEVAIMRRADHCHIVKIVHTYLFKDQFAMIMEPRAESNLENVLQAATPDRISRWFSCLLSAVAYMHISEPHITHRDIKPQNILVANETVFLSDFGISTMGVGRTVPTTILGDPRARSRQYCAPEVEEGRTRGRSPDIFSLGAVFLEMLTVCSYPENSYGQLDNFRNALQRTSDGCESFGLSIQQLGQWMDRLEGVDTRPAWQSSIMGLCREMLQYNRERRPKAADLQGLWRTHFNYQTATLPPPACNCIL